MHMYKESQSAKNSSLAKLTSDLTHKNVRFVISRNFYNKIYL